MQGNFLLCNMESCSPLIYSGALSIWTGPGELVLEGDSRALVLGTDQPFPSRYQMLICVTCPDEVPTHRCAWGAGSRPEPRAPPIRESGCPEASKKHPQQRRDPLSLIRQDDIDEVWVWGGGWHD